MAVQLGDTAPDFTAQTTEGTIRFHEWMGNDWAILFSHPKDFTPVCTTELGAVARLKPEFEKRGAKPIGLSVDGVSDHEGWSRDIEETQGVKLNFPLIADADRSVANLYGMIHPNADDKLTSDHQVATPADWKPGDDVIIVPAVSNEEAKSKFPGGWTELKPYLRLVPDPTA
jgi:alkyl hydroperoxide reductase subunit AhpC